MKRLIALALACAVAGAQSAADAKPAAGADAEVINITQRASALLDKLEYERGREMLENAVRTLPAYKKAKVTTKARLWVLLGRARAELGDAVGADEAFLEAVSFDRRVKLPRSTSPKILEALERARANAPAPGQSASQQPADPPPRRPKPKIDPDAGVPDVSRPDASRPDVNVPDASRPDVNVPDASRPDVNVPDASRPDASRPDASTPDAAPPIDASIVVDAGRDAGVITDAGPDAGMVVDAGGTPDASIKPQVPTPPKAVGPTLRYRVQGTLLAGRTITLVIERENLPKGSKVELYMRRAQIAAFKPEALTKTGTTATKKITMDRPRVELWVRAVKGKKTVAQLGSELDPIVISTQPPPPSLQTAWSSDQVRPRLIETSSTATITAAAATLTSSTALLPPPKPPPPKEEEDDTLLWMGVAGGAVLVAGGVVLTIFLLTRGDDCDAEEGLGCTEIRILPLVSF